MDEPNNNDSLMDELSLKVAIHQSIVTGFFLIPLVVFGMALKRGKEAWSDPRKKRLVYLACHSGMLCAMTVGLYSLSFVATELRWVDHSNQSFSSITWALYVIFLGLFYCFSYQLRMNRLYLAKTYSARWTQTMIVANMFEIMVQLFLIIVRKHLLILT
jgi:hypothetical protein